MKAVNNMNKQKGFTLIELVIVIVILGILAATAAPKFINLQGDAKESARQGVLGAVKGALNLGYAKAAVSGVTSGEVEIQGKFVKIVNGYPSIESDGADSTGASGSAYNLLYLLDIDLATSHTVDDPSGADNTLTITIADDCTVTIVDAAANGTPTVGGDDTCA